MKSRGTYLMLLLVLLGPAYSVSASSRYLGGYLKRLGQDAKSFVLVVTWDSQAKECTDETFLIEDSSAILLDGSPSTPEEAIRPGRVAAVHINRGRLKYLHVFRDLVNNAG